MKKYLILATLLFPAYGYSSNLHNYIPESNNPTGILKPNTHSIYPHSLIEKTVAQQKLKKEQQTSDFDDLKMLTTIYVPPSQNFFALQHQRFSRFLQNFLFTPES